jgi:Domain of unknown function (DUF4375)
MHDDPNPTATLLIVGVWDKIDTDQTLDVFLTTFTAVPRHQGLLYAVWRCDSEVCNGGFHQFFDNNAGLLTDEAIEGFIAIGLPQLANLVVQAKAKLSASDTRDFGARWAALKDLSDDSFDELDQRYYELRPVEGGGFEAAIEKFAKAAPTSE